MLGYFDHQNLFAISDHIDRRQDHGEKTDQ